ncbi:MAG: zinc-binding dehydrogenase [Candidatus Bathyarchaeota archaeon]|nr:MAG: zinc-binding dehydrogenase [Candidatus Bathyarchaeota archaeon]
MKAAVFYGADQPLKIEDIPTPEIGPEEALIKIAACGVCHTDLHYLEGVPTFKKPPIVLGHEASGIVTKVGEKVTNVKENDTVLIPPVLTCGTCHNCRIGRENLCRNIVMIGNSIDGAYAEYTKIPAKDLIKLPTEIPLEEASIISDAMSTPFHALKNRANVRPGDSVVIYGVGGVGLNAVQIAVALGAFVIAVDKIEAKLQHARDLGASETINVDVENPVKAVRRITGGGADVAVEAIGIPEVMRMAYNSVRWGGRAVIVGYSHKDLTISAARLMFREIEIYGSLGCRIVDFPPLVDMVRRGKLKLLISNKMPLDQINEALEMLKKGKIKTRAIVVP